MHELSPEDRAAIEKAISEIKSLPDKDLCACLVVAIKEARVVVPKIVTNNTDFDRGAMVTLMLVANELGNRMAAIVKLQEIVGEILDSAASQAKDSGKPN